MKRGTTRTVRTTKREPIDQTRRFLDVEFRVEPARTRTILVLGEPRRVAMTAPTMFMVSRFDGRPDSTHLHSWAFEREPAGWETPLFASPFYTGLNGNAPHVYPDGVCCFGEEAVGSIKNGEDPVKVFWGSTFSSLPPWLMTASVGPRLAPAPSLRAGPITFEMGRDECYYSAETTPRTVVLGLLNAVERGADTDDGYEGFLYPGRSPVQAMRVRAPWLARPVLARRGTIIRKLRGRAVDAVDFDYSCALPPVLEHG